MNENSFITIMNNVRDYWDSIVKLESALNIKINENFMTKIVDNILNAVSEDMENNDDTHESWVLYYAFELDFGRAKNADKAVTVDGIVYPLTTAKELYDFLKIMNNMTA